MSDPTRADDAGQEQQPWVGRATPPRPAPPSPAVDPYWPPVEVPPVRHPADLWPGYPPVQATRRRRPVRTSLLVAAGALAACCAGGATLALLSSAWLKDTRSSVGFVVPGLNSAVRDGKFEFVVTSVTCGHDTVGRFVVKRAQGQFCVAGLTVRNISQDAQTFADTYQKAVAPDGTIYGADTGAALILNENSSAAFNLINPGNEVTSKIVYDIPRDKTIAKLVLHDSPLSGGVTVSVG